MKIGIDIRPLLARELTGVGEFTFHLLDHLLALDTQNEYYLFYNGFTLPPHVRTLWRNNPHVVHRPHHIPNKLLNASLAFLKWPHIDALTAAHLDCFLSPNPYFAAYTQGVRLIQIVHDLTPVIYPEFFSRKIRLGHRFIYPRSFRQAAQYITVSHTTKEDLSALCGIAKEKIAVVTPGLDPLFHAFAAEETRARVKNKYTLPDHFILYLGAIEPRKNIESVIDAYEEWQRMGSARAAKTHLVIAGKIGWLATPILTRMRTSPFDHKIHFISYVAREDKPALYALADLFVYPSFYEGFGFPPLEALSQGTPVMVSHTSSMGEYFGEHALLIDPYRPYEMAELFDEYIEDNEKIHPREARISYARSFKWSDTAAAVLEYLK